MNRHERYCRLQDEIARAGGYKDHADAVKKLAEKNPKIKGLTVTVLRPAGRMNHNPGIGSKYERVTLIGEGVAQVSEPSETAPAVKLVRRMLGGIEYLHAEPIDRPYEGFVGWMADGNFIHTSDSRFPNEYPIALHDRQEPQEMYDRLSR